MLRLPSVLTLMLLTVLTTVAFAQDNDVAITVYNQDIGLVRELRDLDLDKGTQEYSYDGVAAKIIPTSVRFEAEDVAILEQNFEYDLVSQQALMEKHIGETVEVLLKDELVSGRLLSTTGGIILDTEDGIRMINQGSVISVSFPELPEGLILRPTLRWRLQSDRNGDVQATLAYLTRGLDWEASYVAVVNEGDTELELSGWVQVTNESGADYENAKLKLMAGDVRMAGQQQQPRRFAGDMMMEAADAKGFEEKSFFEYHLYTLPRRVTVADKQIKQIRLIEPAETAIDKQYTFEAWRNNSDVLVELVFDNSEDAGLGMPLPAGLVRLYKEDADDASLQLIGEDRIDHTPRDEELRLATGNAFDIVAERTRMNSNRISNQVRDESYKVELRNRKDDAVEIVVRERFYGDWTLMNQSRQGEKVDATTYEWTVPVPAGEVVELTYTVRFR